LTKKNNKMNRYLITSTLFDGEIEFRYRADEALKHFENRSTMDDNLLSRLFTKFPFTRTALVELCTGSLLTLAQVSVQVLFKDFWEAYGYKVGNKARAEKLWNALTDTDRVAIMEYLPKYDAYLAARPRMEKLYAETFLNQRRWENELPK